MNKLNGLQHIGIPTNILNETKIFYQTLGFQIIDEEDNNGSCVAFLELNGLILEIWESLETNNHAGAINHIALDTSDIESVFEWIKSLGLQLIDKNIKSLPFWDNGIRYFNFYGPNKEIIEICQKL
ncbi:VOC family protein [Bombilactobacillus bombi]|uniref:VOC family protein n=1 Tax=Bombilactobacillus bombi TaxID=1303590 RepID=UPI000E568BAC|nr:VOC family protein [Bombilactobacillus bombi]AXX65079.1 VOC family protein [Bombilactobacillus bombi]